MTSIIFYCQYELERLALPDHIKVCRGILVRFYYELDKPSIYYKILHGK